MQPDQLHFPADFPYAEVTFEDYQAEDIAEFTRRFSEDGDVAAFCTWEQGLGKSLLALHVGRRLGFTKFLILCPPIGLTSWKEQVAEWRPGSQPLFVGRSAQIKQLTPTTDVVVVTHDLTRNDAVRNAVREWCADAFVTVDEVQYLRTPSAQRTGAIYAKDLGCLSHAPKVLLMSGTPVVSWPTDLWSHLARWWPERIHNAAGYRMDYDEFRDRYLLTEMVPIPGTNQRRLRIKQARDGSKGTVDMITELRQRLDGLAIRRLKTETNLPPLRWMTMRLDLAPKDRDALNQEIMEHLPARLQNMAARLVQTPDDQDLADKFLGELEVYREHYGVIMRAQGVAKANAFCRHMRDELDNTRHAILVFALNRSVLNEIEKGLDAFGVVRIDGSTPQTERERVVRAFQDPQGPRVFLGQTLACSSSLTLTRASRVYFPQMSPTPGDNEQAASRCHRKGQTNPVDAHIIFAAGTIDEPMSKRRRAKQTTTEKLIG